MDSCADFAKPLFFKLFFLLVLIILIIFLNFLLLFKTGPFIAFEAFPLRILGTFEDRDSTNPPFPCKLLL